ncbi:MAG: excinuclease ABC subunit UvrA [Planctomycetota bacterium]|nr:excinuclease ABC subunit UvrA [Planctomycetota bacterium]
MEPTNIEVIGAQEHNLKNITVTIPKKQFVVFTGPSGSGKSSLAIDTIYVEGRRRFVESLSAYARQFLGQKEKPRFEKIHGLSPTIAVEQKSASSNPRSTVGTITEILDYLRVLYARLGVQHCPDCGDPVSRQSAQQIVNWIAGLPLKTKVILLAPIFQNRKGEQKDVLDQLRRQGLARARLNGEIFALDQKKNLNKRKKNTLEAVIDRLVVKKDMGARLTDSVETALKIGDGRLIVHIPDKSDTMLSERLACETCQRSFPDLSPQSFSFNSPQGMCADCNGLGHKLEMDPRLIVPDDTKTVEGGAISIWSNRHSESKSFTFGIIRGFAEEHKINLKVPWKKMTQKSRDLMLYGSKKKISVKLKGKRFSGDYVTAFEGIIPMLHRRFLQTSSEGMKAYYSSFMSNKPCDGCNSLRLREESRHVFIADHSLADLCRHSVQEVADFFEVLANEIEGEEKAIGGELLKEVRARLRFLTNVGLDYLSLNRKGPTLSGGESQRIRLASQLGSELSGVVYVLDEPSIGLHARDAMKLVDTLHHLRNQGNSVIVVEHDRDTIEAADWVVDFGPGAGRNGGEVTAAGPPQSLASNPKSLTGRYLSDELEIELPKKRRKINKSKVIEIKGARENNLKNIKVSFPLGAQI